MLTFVSGPDRFRALRFLEEETSRIVKANPSVFVVDIRPEDSEATEFIAQLRSLLNSRSLFDDLKVVVIRECFSGPAGKSGIHLAELLKLMASSKDYFFIFEDDASNFPEADFGDLDARRCYFTFLSENDFISWIEKETARLGGKISPKAAELLSRLYGPKTGAAVPELMRLIALGGGKVIRAEDVKIFEEERSGGKPVFKLLDAIEAGNLGLALERFSKIIKTSSDLSYILATLSYHLRSLIAGKRRSFGSKFWQERKIKRPSLNIQKLQQLLILLHEVDVRWKSGQEDPVVSLERYLTRFSKTAA